METERLIINELTADDKLDYFENISHDKKVLETFICTYAESLDDLDFNRYLGRKDIFAIRLKESKKLIGILTLLNGDDNATEIGYGIGSKYWNNGYVTEAVKSFIKYIFESTNLKTIYASYFVGNIASRRVMEKCGMQYSHSNKNELEYLGISRDLDYYRIDK